MRKYKFFSMVAVVLLLTGCGGGTTEEEADDADDANDTADDADDTDDTTGATITLTGSLGTGTITSLAVKSVEAAEGYKVVVVDNASNKTYSATTGADGTFSVEVPADSTYLVSLIHEGSYVGPTVFASEGTEVNTAIAPSEDTDLGPLIVDEDEGYAVTENVPDSVDVSVTAIGEDGKPFGAGDDGKLQNGDVTEADLREDSDQDQDGVPNLFDADEDNDGIRNGIAELPSGASVESDYVQAVYSSSNIWAHRDEVAEEAYNLIGLTLHVDPVDGQEERIASVQCVDVPSSIASVTTLRWSSSLGVLEADYPDENSPWSESDYNLYRTTELPEEEWVVTIRPGAAMNVGDTFTLRVTTTDSTTEDFFLSMSYVLTDWARLQTYNGNPMPTDGVGGTSQSPITFDSDTLTVTFSKAEDEDGNPLEGLNYSVIHGLTTCDEAGCLVPGGGATEEAATDNGDGTLSFEVPTEAAGTYYITPVAESTGQRNGEETWFTRE